MDEIDVRFPWGFSFFEKENITFMECQFSGGELSLRWLRNEYNNCHYSAPGVINSNLYLLDLEESNTIVSIAQRFHRKGTQANGAFIS